MSSERNVIDVLVPAWNRSDTIERAIWSCLSQPEVRTAIVVDDASTDDTSSKAARIGKASGRVIVLTLTSNSGPSAARNTALDASEAPWVAILDADDYFLPGRIAKLMAYTQECDIVADDILQIREPQLGLRPVMFDEQFEPWRIDFATFIQGNTGHRVRERREYGFFKPIMRRSFLDRTQLRYDEKLRLGEDYSFYARALVQGARFLVVPAQGYVSVARTDSLTEHHTRHDLEQLRNSDKELSEVFSLTIRERRAVMRHCSSIDARIKWLLVIDAFKARNIAAFLTPFFETPGFPSFCLVSSAKRLFADLSGCSKK